MHDDPKGILTQYSQLQTQKVACFSLNIFLLRTTYVKNHFFVFKSYLKLAKTKFLITFMIGCKKANFWFCAYKQFLVSKTSFWVHETCINKCLALLSCFCEPKLRFCTPKRYFQILHNQKFAFGHPITKLIQKLVWGTFQTIPSKMAMGHFGYSSSVQIHLCTLPEELLLLELLRKK